VEHLLGKIRFGINCPSKQQSKVRSVLMWWGWYQHACLAGPTAEKVTLCLGWNSITLSLSLLCKRNVHWENLLS